MLRAPAGLAKYCRHSPRPSSRYSRSTNYRCTISRRWPGVATILTIVLWEPSFQAKAACGCCRGRCLGVIVGTLFAFIFALPIYGLVELPSDLTTTLNIPTVDALGGFLDTEILTLGRGVRFLVASASKGNAAVAPPAD